MKTLLCLLLALGFVTRLAAGDSDIPHVTVFGTAVTEAKPDLLRWSVVVSNKGPELAAISTDHGTHTAAVLRLLNAKGIRPEEMQTSGMRFTENREFRGNTMVLDGYVATTQVAFTMRNVGDYQETWIALSRLTGVTVEWVTWDVSNRIELQNRTREDALRSAKTKAEKMAIVLGGRLAGPIAIEEMPVEDHWMGRSTMNNMVRASAGQDEPQGAIAPGAVAVRVRVRVIFQLGTSS